MEDIALSIEVLEEELVTLKYRLNKDHLLLPDRSKLEREVKHLQSAIDKIKTHFGI